MLLYKDKLDVPTDKLGKNLVVWGFWAGFSKSLLSLEMAENLWAWLSANPYWNWGIFPALGSHFGGSGGGALSELLWCSLAGTTSACSWEMTSCRVGCPARLSHWPCWAPTPCSRSLATTTRTSTAATTSASSASRQTTLKSWRTKWSSCTRATGKQRASVWTLACFRYHLGASDVRFCSGVLSIFLAIVFPLCVFG